MNTDTRIIEVVGSHDNRIVVETRSDTSKSSEPGYIIFLHGGGQTRHAWARAAESLSTHGWTTVTMDARGHGDSDWAPGYRLDGFVDDLTAVIHTIAPRRPPIIVGASLGGRTALTAVGERKVAVSGLVLADVAARSDPAEVHRIQSFFRETSSGFESLAAAGAAIDAFRGRTSTGRDPRGLSKNLRQRPDGRWYWHWDPRFLTYGDDVAEDDGARAQRAAEKVTVPALLVRGRRSAWSPRRRFDSLRQAIPHLDVAEVDSDHMITGDDNASFTTRLTAFTASLDDETVCGRPE